MKWQESRAACRARYVAKYDDAESQAYEGYVGTLSDEDEVAYLTDMSSVFHDGFYGRDGWRGVWEEEVDVLPLSACQTMAMIPYLLEASGFRIDAVEMMDETTKRPATRTKRYIVVAKKTS
jgi:hypothetical protein